MRSDAFAAAKDFFKKERREIEFFMGRLGV